MSKRIVLLFSAMLLTACLQNSPPPALPVGFYGAFLQTQPDKRA